MPFQPGTPDSLNTRNDEIDGQGIDIDSSVANKNAIRFFTGLEDSAPPYNGGAVPVGPSKIEVSSDVGGFVELVMSGPPRTDGTQNSALRLGANVNVMHANNKTFAHLDADIVQIGRQNPWPTSGPYHVTVMSRDTLVLGATGRTVVVGQLEDYDPFNFGALGTRFGAHKKWQRVATGSQNPFWSANSRHGLPVGNWACEVYWDGGPLVHLQAYYDTGAQGFANGAWAFTPQDITFQVDGGTETKKLTLPTSPSTTGRPIAGVAALSNGTNYRTRVTMRQIRNAGIANGAECWVFDYNDSAGIATNLAPFTFGRLVLSLSATFPII